MSSTSDYYPHALPTLPGPGPHAAIADALYRATVGLDTNNATLFASAIAPDITFTHANESFSGAAAIQKNVFERVEKMDTTHTVSNVRINVASNEAKEAFVTATVLAQHYRAGDGLKGDGKRFLVGALYEVDVVRDEKEEGVWRIRKWVLKLNWADGDWDIVRPAEA